MAPQELGINGIQGVPVSEEIDEWARDVARKQKFGRPLSMFYVAGDANKVENTMLYGHG
jgi:hypothetical protein